MIVSKTTYEASDGKSFDTEFEALEYEKTLEDGTSCFILIEHNLSGYENIIFASNSYKTISNKSTKMNMEQNKNVDSYYSYSIRKVTKI